MPGPIEFYFDFSSPYGYIASTLIDDLGGRVGREVRWKPFLLGPVFKANGQAPLVDVPMKGDYSKRDFDRTARYHGVPFSLPAKFPIGAIAALRSFYWIDDRDAAKAKAFAQAVYKAYFADGVDITDAAQVLAIAQRLGIDGTALSAALNDQAVKDRAKQEVDAIIAKGAFGSPFFIVDGEPFWGNDRLPMLEDWVRRGGW
ncbi:2-hydroxychromene-2-carboxylate isomerase [Betaproteobacteria bacterium GR16-43]|nr:2-hydroxychromene-2-carboxylate isomerase [Betaproteobacteria bacterium GR16-43]